MKGVITSSQQALYNAKKGVITRIKAFNIGGFFTANENTRTFFIEQPWDEKFHHFEFRGKVASPILNLFMLCPNINKRMLIDQVRTPLHQKFSIDITAQIKRLNIDSKAKCNITVSSSNVFSASHNKQRAADDFSLIILSKKENTRTLFREIAELSVVANDRHLDESPSKRSGSNRCRRSQMKVDLWRIGFMNKYVIHPSTVDLGSCSGECHAKNIIEKNASNRGVFLSLYQMTLGTKKTMTRCVPEKMTKLSILHEDETGVYVSYVGNIIIDSCACQ